MLGIEEVWLQHALDHGAHCRAAAGPRGAGRRRKRPAPLLRSVGLRAPRTRGSNRIVAGGSEGRAEAWPRPPPRHLFLYLEDTLP